VFGNSVTNTQNLTGSVGITGSLNVNGNTSTQLKYFLKESNTNAWSIYTDGANGPFYIKDEYNSANRLTIGITGNVGIGTASPTTKLTIDNSASSNTNHIDFIGPSSSGGKGHVGYFAGGLYLTSNYYYAGGQNNDTGSLGQGSIVVGSSPTVGASSISFALSDPGATSPSTKVNILSNGNVGIGTTSPTGSLQIGDLQSGTNGSINGASGTIRRAIVNCPYPGASALTLGYYSLAYGIDIWVNGDGTGLAPVYFDQKQNEAIIFRRNTYGTAAESMRITGAGNVGIGTTSPANKLFVVASGTATTNGNNSGLFVSHLTTGATTDGIGVGSNGSASYKWIQSYNGNLSLNPEGNNVGIGTTSPSIKLQVVESGANWVADFKNYGSGAYGVRIDLSGSTGTAGAYAFRIYTQTNDGFYLLNNGAFYAQGVYNYTSSSGTAVYVDSGGNLYRFTSSLRYKRDIVSYTNGLNELLKIKPKFYKSKNPKEGEKVFAGLIAEQIDEIGLTEFVEYNKEGQPDAVHYSAMTALLVKAIQELKAQNDTLKDTLQRNNII
jgi:hypothetical protein